MRSQAIVKLDMGFGGMGNAMIDLAVGDLDAVIDAMEFEDADGTVELFLAALERGGGVVEERLTGIQFRSPSVQLRASPTGEVEVLSTHDQVLGGTNGLTFLGSRFPADRAYAREITTLARRVGERLDREGVLGRFAVDFVVVIDPLGAWHPYAIEANPLRDYTHLHGIRHRRACGLGDPRRSQVSAAAGGPARH